MRRSRTLASALVLLVLTAAPRPSAAAWPHDPDNGNAPVCLVPGDQFSPASVSDGAGGVIIAWQDNRSGSANIYAQHISAAGVPQWAVGGVAVCTALGNQETPVIASDDAGGAIVTWCDLRGGTDSDIYAQRIDKTGATRWADNGEALCTAQGDQTGPAILSDGLGGAFVTWQDTRNLVDDDIYAQRVDKEGATAWTANGVALCVAPFYQDGPRLASDGAGGAFVTWYDSRTGSSYNIYAQRLSATGTPLWTTDGVAVSTAAVVQIRPAIVSNGAGGAIIAWADLRDGFNYDIYAQSITASGVTQWTAGGVGLCSAAGDQYNATIASDGAGGAIVAWKDTRTFVQSHIYAQRISAAGLTRWAAEGVALCTVAGDQLNPTTVSDGAGGAIVAWQDTRTTTNHDLYAQRISGAGTPLWTWNGVALCTAVNNQQLPAITSDGAGGAIVTWQDQRDGNDIYAQRIERFGMLGSPEPAIVNVKDYPNDQGGKVRIQWDASYLDAEPYSSVGDYYVWRQAPPFAAEAALRGGAARLLEEGESPAAAGRPVYRITEALGVTYYWEYVTSQLAQGFPGYSLVTTTGSDSVGAGNPPTLFMIEAVANYYSVPMAHWNSAAGSGYSVDNLPPVTPAPFTGQYAAGTTYLHWNRNTETDLAGYRLYRGHSASFIPSAENLASAQPDTGYADVAGSPYVYKLTAVDAHGNESPVATLILGGMLGVNDAPPSALSFAAPSPNPARGAATLAYTLSRAGHVRLSVYDAAGRRVSVLRDGEETAGAHGGSFALRDAAGRELASGLYLLQLEAEGRVLTRRLATIR